MDTTNTTHIGKEVYKTFKTPLGSIETGDFVLIMVTLIILNRIFK